MLWLFNADRTLHLAETIMRWADVSELGDGALRECQSGMSDFSTVSGIDQSVRILSCLCLARGVGAADPTRVADGCPGGSQAKQSAGPIAGKVLPVPHLPVDR